MIPRWIADHYRHVRGLMPGQFPANQREVPQPGEDTAWLQLWRMLLCSTPGDAIVSLDADALAVEIEDDQTARFPVGGWTEWGGSSVVRGAQDGGNDGRYEVAAVSFDGSVTTVTLTPLGPATGFASAALGDLGYLRGADTRSRATWGVQELEEVLVELAHRLNLARATGRTLEVFGEILGLSRTDPDDEVYRHDLRLQAAILHGHGRIAEILDASARLAGVTLAVLREHVPARFSLFLRGITPEAGTVGRIRRMKGGGIAMDVFYVAGDNPFVLGADRDAGGVAIDPPGDDPDGSGFGEAFFVAIATAGGAGAGMFEVGGNATAAIVAGDPLRMVGSTANDGLYTVLTSTFNGGTGRTEVVPVEAVPDGTDDGTLVYEEGAAGSGAGSGDFVELAA